jgi:hypothetical protein
MRRTNQKTSNDVLVTDPDAAMRRMADATRQLLSANKQVNSRPARKRRKDRP